MFFFQEYFSLYAFAVGWGLLVCTDFALRMFGMAGTYAIDVGLIFPFVAPIMSVLVIFAFLYFLTSPNKELSKKFYASCNYLMLIVCSSVLAIDLVLRLFAFDQTYCRG